MTIREIIGDLWLKCFCISDFVHDSLKIGIDEEVLKAKEDKALFEIAIECLKRTNIYFEEQTRDIENQGTLL